MQEVALMQPRCIDATFESQNIQTNMIFHKDQRSRSFQKDHLSDLDHVKDQDLPNDLDLFK